MRDRRQTISVLLSGVRAELGQRLLPAGVIAGTGISIATSGSTVTVTATGGGGGSSTFVDLTDTPSAITAGQCVQGNGPQGRPWYSAPVAPGVGAARPLFGLTDDTPSAFVNLSFLRSTASGLQFRTPAQVRADIGANDASNSGD